MRWGVCGQPAADIKFHLQVFSGISSNMISYLGRRRNIDETLKCFNVRQLWAHLGTSGLHNLGRRLLLPPSTGQDKVRREEEKRKKEEDCEPADGMAVSSPTSSDVSMAMRGTWRLA